MARSEPSGPEQTPGFPSEGGILFFAPGFVMYADNGPHGGASSALHVNRRSC